MSGSWQINRAVPAPSYELLEERVAERTRELRTLLDISGSLTLTHNLPDLLRSILDRLRVVLDFTGASIFLLEGDALTLLEYQGDLPRDQLAAAWPLERAQHAAAVIARREPVILADVCGDEPLARAWREQTVTDLGELPATVRTWMGAPMLLRDDVIGILAVDHQRPNAYRGHHAELLLTVANLAAAAIENARLHTAALGKAALEERQRLARELHDSVSQALYGIALGARTARTLLDRDPALVAEPLDYVLNLADAGLTEMRALIFALRPESLEREGLSVALTRQADALRARYGIAVQTAIGGEPDVPLAVKEALSRIAQEALHNVVKHANAKSVDLRLTLEDGSLTMVISDDGVGFDPSAPHLGHLGLQSMRERIAALRGTIDVQSAPCRGARLAVRIPISG